MIKNDIKITIYLNIYELKFRLDSAGMMVTDGCTQACQSPMRNVSYRWGKLVSDGFEMVLQSGMSVSDEACQGLRWVSDNNNFFHEL